MAEEAKIGAELTCGVAPFTQVKVGREYVFEGATFSNKDWKAFKAADPGKDYGAAETQYRFGVNLGIPSVISELPSGPVKDLALHGYNELASNCGAGVASAEQDAVQDAFDKYHDGGWIKRAAGEREARVAVTKLDSDEKDAQRAVAKHLLKLDSIDPKAATKEQVKAAMDAAKVHRAENSKLWQKAMKRVQETF